MDPVGSKGTLEFVSFTKCHGSRRSPYSRLVYVPSFTFVYPCNGRLLLHNLISIVNICSATFPGLPAVFSGTIYIDVYTVIPSGRRR